MQRTQANTPLRIRVIPFYQSTIPRPPRTAEFFLQLFGLRSIWGKLEFIGFLYHHAYNYTSILIVRKVIRMKSERLYLVVPAWLKESMKEIADSKGITLSEYIKDSMKVKVKEDQKQKADAD